MRKGLAATMILGFSVFGISCGEDDNIQGPFSLEGTYALKSYTVKFLASGLTARREPPFMTGMLTLAGGRYSLLITSVDIPDDEPETGAYTILGNTITFIPDEIDSDDPEDGPNTSQFSFKHNELTLTTVVEKDGVSATVVFVRI